MIHVLLENIREKDDESSFEKLFQLYYPRLLHFSTQFVHSPEAAEELVSDVFTRLWVNRKSTDQIHNPETYLFISVKNASLNYLKQFSRYRVTDLEQAGGNQFINTHDPARETERRELFYKLTETIESLPLKSRLVFKLIKEDGLKYKDVAEILDISPRTVETHLVRAIKKLDKVVCDYQGTSTKRRKSTSRFRSIILFSLFYCLL